MDRKIRARLASFAKSLEGPLGNVPLDRAIRSDLELFQILRDSGASWVQIAKALTAAGAQREDGSPFTDDHIRSAVSRQLKRQTEEQTTPSVTAHSRRSTPASNDRVISSVAKKSQGSSTKSPAPKSSDSSAQRSSIAPTGATNKTSSVLQKLARTRQLRET